MSVVTSPSSETRPIRFFLNNRAIEISDAVPTTSVLSYLRQQARLTGTKEGCAEGDCGACTVVVAEKMGSDVQMKAVNACIQFLPTLDGKALFTVEALQQPTGKLHPVQEAMVNCHGSQCGFCTPGFVMSLWALYLESDKADVHRASETEVRQAITGNLCRCTGYRPIIEAGRCMFDLPRVEFDREALKTMLGQVASPASLNYVFKNQRFFAPRTLEEFVALRKSHPRATIVGGGTDVGLWVNKQLRELDDVIYTGEVVDLKTTNDSDARISIGAAVTLNDAYAVLKRYHPEMNEMWERFASMPIRNAGTLGGNVVNGSPIGDAMPALIALGATVTLASTGGMRQMALETLYLGYQQKAMSADEVLVSVEIPKPSAALQFRNYKLSKRFDSDISAVCAAFAITLKDDVVTSCRIAFGGMAAIPKRAAATEETLIGRRWDEAGIELAMTMLSKDFAPLSDMRASAEYRLTVAGNLLRRFYLETRLTASLSAADVSVFA
jgi:xanthine dehydrogenase small subunit